MRLIGVSSREMQKRAVKIAAASGTNRGDTLFGNMAGPPHIDAIPAGCYPSSSVFDLSIAILFRIPPPVHE